MISTVKPNVFAMEFQKFGSIVYLVKLNDQNILIDTSSEENQDQLIKDLKELKISPEEIQILILTHNHYDHVGNIDLFSNAKIYGDNQDFQNILSIDDLPIKEFEIIKTPGHTKGSFCILYNKILFSGDTIFHNGYIGRTDLPESSPRDMQESLKKIQELDFDILCPGH